jgi:hypothetical protein
MKTLVLSLLLVGSILTTAVVQSEKGAIKNGMGAQKTDPDAVGFQRYTSYFAKVPYATFMIYGNLSVGESVRKLLHKVWATCKPTPFKNRGANWTIRTKGETASIKRIDQQPR